MRLLLRRNNYARNNTNENLTAFMASIDIKLRVSVLTLFFFSECVYISFVFCYQISGLYHLFTQVWKTDAQTLMCMQWTLGILVQM